LEAGADPNDEAPNPVIDVDRLARVKKARARTGAELTVVPGAPTPYGVARRHHTGMTAASRYPCDRDPNWDGRHGFEHVEFVPEAEASTFARAPTCDLPLGQDGAGVLATSVEADGGTGERNVATRHADVPDPGSVARSELAERVDAPTSHAASGAHGTNVATAGHQRADVEAQLQISDRRHGLVVSDVFGVTKTDSPCAGLAPTAHPTVWPEHAS